MSDKKTSQTQITVTVELDEQKMPENINWSSVSPGHEHSENAKAAFIAFWDGKNKQALRIDLWTKDMQIDEMYMFYYQTLHSMADTLKRSSGNEEAVLNMKAFANLFGENTEVVKRVDEEGK